MIIAIVIIIIIIIIHPTFIEHLSIHNYKVLDRIKIK